MVPIGQWVLREACSQARAWADAGLPPIPVAVNISALEFRSAGFLDCVRKVLGETRLQPQYLELEVTETVLMRDTQSAAAVLRELKAIGVGLAIDDFGTGCSSLSHLRQFPIDTLKIDPSFVREMTANSRVATIVSTVINLGRSLQQRVIAEGVETGEQLAFLLRESCGEAQGFHFSRPVSANEFVTLLHPPKNLAAPLSAGLH
jgi:EAL domain-containing protein (putative c-di-GMP-specific phosphodiesterase class I)